MTINHNEIIQYTILLIVPFILMLCHNWLISGVKTYDQQLVAIREALIKIGVSLVLFIATVLLMLFLAPKLKFLFTSYGLFAISFSLISSFLIILTFHTLLTEMRGSKRIFKFFTNNNLLLTILFIISTELVVLYWLKEIDIYVQAQFFIFVIGYAVLITMAGIFLGFPTQKGQILHDEWRLIIVAVIDPIIIVFIAYLLMKVILNIFYHFYS